MNPSAQKADALRLLRCQVGSESYFLELSRVASIHRTDHLTALPDPGGDPGEAADDPWVGSVALPAGDVPVQDLARRFGAASSRAAGEHGHVIVLATQPWAWGLQVDRLANVPPVEPRCVHPVPVALRAPDTAWARRVVLFEGEAVPLLDPDAMGPEAPPGADTAPPRDAAPEGFDWEQGQGDRLIVFGVADGRAAGERPVRLGLRISQVVEVLEEPAVHRLPGAEPHVLGVAPWRDRVLPVLDLARRLGHEAPPDPDERARVLVTWTGRVLAGLRIRPDVQVVSLPVAHQPSTRELGPAGEFARGVVEILSATLMLLDLDRVV